MRKSSSKYHEKYNSFYQTKRWKILRAQKFYDANGLCEMCYQQNVIRKGKEVHHIVPIEQDWSKRYDYDNLMLLCPDHHNEVHQRINEFENFLNEWNKI